MPCHILGNQAVTGTLFDVIADPETLRSRLSCDDADHGGTDVRIGGISLALIGASAGGIGGIAMGCAFFPPRSDTIRRPQRRCRASPRSAQSRSDWPGCAGGGYGVVYVTGPTHARGAPWARLWRPRGAATPRWPGV